LFDADTGAACVNGHLIFVRDEVLMAQPFDAGRLEVHGEAFRVADRVNFGNGVAAVSALPGGTLVFRSGSPGDRRQMIWFDRTGHQLQALATPDIGGATTGVELSPNGRRLVSGRQVDGNQTLWTLEMSRGIWSVLTPGRLGAQGVWSPDGSRLAFIRTVDGNPDLFVGPSSADGS
jgi:WD40 repeat protein